MPPFLNWELRTPAVKPAIRIFPGLADSNGAFPLTGFTDCAVLFGGDTSGAGAVQNDTWVWDDVIWNLLAPAHKPPARQGAPLVWFQDLFEFVIYGGYDAGLHVIGGSTWGLAGVDWNEHVIAGPGARGGHAMAYDANFGNVVLFGGYNYDTGVFSGDTWILDSTPAWTDLTPSLVGPSPAARGAELCMMTLPGGPYIGQVCLFSGKDVDPPATGIQDIWVLDQSVPAWVDLTGTFPSLPPAMISPCFGGRSTNQLPFPYSKFLWLFGGITGSGPLTYNQHTFGLDPNALTFNQMDVAPLFSTQPTGNRGFTMQMCGNPNPVGDPLLHPGPLLVGGLLPPGTFMDTWTFAAQPEHGGGFDFLLATPA